MSLAATERLLALLVRHPNGVARDTARAALGVDVDPAAATLVQRGHALQTQDDGLLRLECAAHHFDPQTFETARRGRFGQALEVWEEAASTNDLARAASEAATADGALWIAEQQTRGRGRQGRVWECAPHAGLLVSVLADLPRAAPERRTLLPLAIGLGCCEALRALTGLDVRPKWPNDLFLDGRKLAGLLVEASSATPRVVIGLGLNVRRGAGPALTPSVALEEFMPGASREALLAGILEGVERRYDAWCSGATATLSRDYAALEISLGRRVRARIGATTIEGRAIRLSDQGLLCVESDAGGIRELAAGEVHLL